MDNLTNRKISERHEKDLTKGYYNPELKKSVENAKKYKTRSKIYGAVSLVIFSIAIIGISACLIFMERPQVSEIEKRKLAERPELSAESFFSGNFTDEYSLYFSDTVPFREKLVSINSYIKKLCGVSSPTFYGNVEIVADDNGSLLETDIQPTETFSAAPGFTETEAPVRRETDVPAEESGASAASSSAASETAASSSASGLNVSEFSNNGIVVDGVKMYGENAGVMLFGGNKKQGLRYAEIINKYSEALGDGVNVYNLVVPTSAEFYLPSKFSKFSSSEKDAIDNIYANLSDKVTPVDAYSVLEDHKDEYIYFRTDHHWTPLGAYYAYTAFAEALGMEYHPIEDYEERIKYDFIGSLYGYTNDITLKNSPEEFHYFMPPEVEYKTSYYHYSTLQSQGTGVLFHEYVDGSNCYGMFLGADAVHVKITTNAGSGRKIVMFKESYGNAFAPFLVNNFDEIYVIDIRYFGRNAVDYIRQVGATDVLFINNCFAANTSSLISGIERLYESKTGTVTMPPAVTTAPASTAVSKAAPGTDKNGAGTKKAGTKKANGTDTKKAPDNKGNAASEPKTAVTQKSVQTSSVKAAAAQ